MLVGGRRRQLATEKQIDVTQPAHGGERTRIMMVLDQRDITLKFDDFLAAQSRDRFYHLAARRTLCSEHWNQTQLICGGRTQSERRQPGELIYFLVFLKRIHGNQTVRQRTGRKEQLPDNGRRHSDRRIPGGISVKVVGGKTVSE